MARALLDGDRTLREIAAAVGMQSADALYGLAELERAAVVKQAQNRHGEVRYRLDDCIKPVLVDVRSVEHGTGNTEPSLVIAGTAMTQKRSI